MLIEKLNMDKIKKHYGKKYSKILTTLKPFEDSGKMKFSIDKDCGRYLELFGESTGNSGLYLKINHGISNAFPYNTWFKAYSYEKVELNHFATQEEVVQYIKKVL